MRSTMPRYHAREIGLCLSGGESPDAESVRREAVNRLAETYVLSARIAAHRGQWREALDLYDQALAMDQPNFESLQVERIRMLVSCGKREEAKEQIHTLQSTFSEPQKALIDLYLGELLLGEWGDPKGTVALVRQAIDSGTLPASDEEYAHGLVAENTVEALGQLVFGTASWRFDSCRRAFSTFVGCGRPLARESSRQSLLTSDIADLATLTLHGSHPRIRRAD